MLGSLRGHQHFPSRVRRCDSACSPLSLVSLQVTLYMVPSRWRIWLRALKFHFFGRGTCCGSLRGTQPVAMHSTFAEPRPFQFREFYLPASSVFVSPHAFAVCPWGAVALGLQEVICLYAWEFLVSSSCAAFSCFRPDCSLLSSQHYCIVSAFS